MGKTFKLLLPALITLAFLAGCQQSDVITEQLTQVMPEGEYRLMTPAYYRDSEDGDAIQVRFYESQRIFDLSKAHAEYDAIREMIDNSITTKQPLRIYTAAELMPYVVLRDAAAPSLDELELYKQKFESTTENINAKKAVPSFAALVTVFNYCASQGCATGTATIDYCIPFQYVVDGCYARAHKMRQIMIENYNLSCEKVFSYEGPGAGSLAVDAGDCCVFWWYHVAPLVSVKNPGGGFTKYVVDPSMFSEPVSIDTWTSAQENISCSPSANFGYYEITPGYIYTPGGGTDNSYVSTNFTLQLYANLETCM